mgnify:CR=1 FL=1
MRCRWCGQFYREALSWSEIFGVKEQDLLCGKCRQSLTFISGEICRVCGRMRELTDPSYFQKEICVDCLRWEEDENWRNEFFQNRSLYVYNEAMKQFMIRFKFRGDAAFADLIKFDWKRFWRKHDANELVVPIPLSEERLYERGFNQSLILAQMLTDDPADLLIRPHPIEKQSKKTRKERVNSGQQRFELKDEAAVKDKEIVLIDDIYTTGTTVRNAAKTLYQHGARRVRSLTLARAV